MENNELKTLFRALTASLYSILIGLSGLSIISSFSFSSIYNQLSTALIIAALVSLIISAISFGFEYWKLSLGALGFSFILSGASELLVLISQSNLSLDVAGPSIEILIGLVLILAIVKEESIKLVTIGLITSLLLTGFLLLIPVNAFLSGEKNITYALSLILTKASNSILLIGMGSILSIIVALSLIGGFLLSSMRGSINATRGGRIAFAIAGISLTFGVAFTSLYYGVKAFRILYSLLAYSITETEYLDLTNIMLPLLVITYVLVSLIYISLEGTLYEIAEAVKKPPKPKPKELPKEKPEEVEEKMPLELPPVPTPKEEVGLEEEFPELPEIEEFEI